jgi:two-component system OmpR family response regulator
MDGLEVLKALRARAMQASVLVLSARGELEDRVRGLDLGADDYLTKPFDVDELEARVRTLLRRQAGLKSAVLSHGSITLDLNTRSFMSQGSPLDMPARERSLLETLFVRAGKVVPKQAIIESLASFDDDLSANAIEQYVSRLRKRLAPYGLTVRTARGIGYYLEAAKPE